VSRISGEVEELAASADGKVLGFMLSPCNRSGLQVVAIHRTTGQNLSLYVPNLAIDGALSTLAW
jgi:hypothetical protein